MSELIKAAKQALEELQNARDHIWLLPEKAQPLTEKQMLKKLRAAIIALHQAIAEAEKQPVHASDILQERVAEKAKGKHKWVGLTEEELCKTVLANLDETLWTLTKVIEAKLKEKNAA